MHTTVDIEEDLLRRLRQEAARSHAPLDTTLNRVLRQGLDHVAPERTSEPYRCPTFSMGEPVMTHLDRALEAAALLEDEETLRKLNRPA